MKYFLLWLSVISVVGIIMTVADKISAKMGAWRISEKSLLCVAALGGSVAMLATMLLIRHKTRHVEFMAGIPLIIIIQVVFLVFVVNGAK